jgi:PAS domain S-box-containing protein
MQHLPEKWLKKFSYYYLVFFIAILGIYIFQAISQKSLLLPNENLNKISLYAATFALVGLIYITFIQKRVVKANLFVGYIAGLMIFAATNSALLEGLIKSPLSIILLVNTTVIIGLSTAFGYIIGMFAILVASIIFSLTMSGEIAPSILGKSGDAIHLLIQIVIVFILFILFRKKYVSVTGGNRTYIEKYFVDNKVVSLLTDSIGDGIVIIDKNQIVRSINPTALKLINQNHADTIGLNYRSILKLRNTNNTNLEPLKEPISSAFSSLTPIRRELLLSAPGKQQIYVDITVSVIQDPNTHELYGAVIILRDISKKKQEENARTEFISTASHEMRTPVAAIEGYLALALNPTVSKVDEKARSFLQKAHESTQHLGRLFKDLLVSANAEDGRLVSRPSVIEVGELIEQLADYYKPLAGKKNLQLELITTSGAEGPSKKENLRVIKPLYYTYADRDRIKEIVSNLIDNAIKYTDTGKITVGITGNNEVVQFFVKDTGVGIAPEDVPHLFQKFYRVDSSATRVTSGTGLGLYICKKIVDLYKGRIWAESKLSVGTTFFVNLTRLSSTEAETIKKRDALSVDGSTIPQK